MGIGGLQSVDIWSPAGLCKLRRWTPFVAVNTVLVLVGMSWSLRLVDADTLLGPIMSTQKLTFYYWQQDRLANIVPALASPFRDLEVNFYVQATIHGLAFFGLISMFALIQERGQRPASSPIHCAIVTLFSGLVALISLGRPTSAVFLFTQHYALVYFLVLAGCFAVYRAEGRSALVGGALLIVTAEVVDPSVLLFAPVVFTGAALQRKLRRGTLIGAVFAGAALLSALASKTFRTGTGKANAYTSFSVNRMLRNLPTVLEHLVASVHPGVVAPVLVLSIAVLVMSWSAIASWLRLSYVLMTLFAAAWLLMASGVRWVETNDLSFRYFFPLYLLYLMLLVGASATVGARLVGLAAIKSARLPMAGLAGVVMSALVWAIPRLPTIDELDAVDSVASQVAVAENAHARLIVGDYFTAWPVVFRMLAADVPAFGITYRGQVLSDEVRSLVASARQSGVPITALCLEPDASACARTFSTFVDETWQIDSIIRDGSVALVTLRFDPS